MTDNHSFGRSKLCLWKKESWGMVPNVGERFLSRSHVQALGLVHCKCHSLITSHSIPAPPIYR